MWASFKGNSDLPHVIGSNLGMRQWHAEDCYITCSLIEAHMPSVYRSFAYKPQPFNGNSDLPLVIGSNLGMRQ